MGIRGLTSFVEKKYAGAAPMLIITPDTHIIVDGTFAKVNNTNFYFFPQAVVTLTIYTLACLSWDG